MENFHLLQKIEKFNDKELKSYVSQFSEESKQSTKLSTPKNKKNKNKIIKKTKIK